MAVIQSNPALLLRAFVETARDLFPDANTRSAWLKQLRNFALVGNDTQVDAVLSNLQNWGATNVSMDGSATQWIREMSSPVIAQLAQAALDALEIETQGMAGPGSVRHADFSQQPCTLG